ncbi:MAG: dihydroneopterin aldolase [Pseudomonadota bacterium]
MDTEIELAFAHPEARAKANAPHALDRIAVRELVLDADIGAFQAERGVKQRLQFDIVVEVAAASDIAGDDVDRILSYDRVTEAIEAALLEERLNLLETLAERVAERILLHAQALRVFVRIAKLDRGPGTLGVEIVRRKSAGVGGDARDVPQPIVLALAADAMGPELSGWLDSLAARGRPVVIAVGPQPIAAPRARANLAQRRIDLLALEQSAWVLAGLDARCMVVGTRTELDWGIRHGQISVWAPSKMVLDAVDGPGADMHEAGALISWFAAQLNASEIIAIGLDVDATDIPVRHKIPSP